MTAPPRPRGRPVGSKNKATKRKEAREAHIVTSARRGTSVQWEPGAWVPKTGISRKDRAAIEIAFRRWRHYQPGITVTFSDWVRRAVTEQVKRDMAHYPAPIEGFDEMAGSDGTGG